MTNEILMFFRSENKHQTNVVASMEDTLRTDTDDNNLTLKDTLASEVNISMDTGSTYLANDIKVIAKEILTEREYICFMNHTSDEPLTQMALAKQLGQSQVNVSRAVTRAVTKIKAYYKEKGVE